MNLNNCFKLTKIAFSVIELNDPANAGYSIAQTIKFLLRRIPFDKRFNHTLKIKNKIINLNEKEISSKQIPNTAILGQIIAMMKNLLHGNDPKLIRNILSNVYKNL